jgi:hypothetical protein
MARCNVGNTVIANFARADKPGFNLQAQVGGKVAKTRHGRGHEDRSVGSTVQRFGRTGRFARLVCIALARPPKAKTGMTPCVGGLPLDPSQTNPRYPPSRGRTFGLCL